MKQRKINLSGLSTEAVEDLIRSFGAKKEVIRDAVLAFGDYKLFYKQYPKDIELLKKEEIFELIKQGNFKEIRVLENSEIEDLFALSNEEELQMYCLLLLIERKGWKIADPERLEKRLKNYTLKKVTEREIDSKAYKILENLEFEFEFYKNLTEVALQKRHYIPWKVITPWLFKRSDSEQKQITAIIISDEGRRKEAKEFYDQINEEPMC